MATIGTFTSTGNGFTGTVRTLALNAKAKLVRVENPSDKGPHFRIRSSWTIRASRLRSTPP